MKVYLLRKSGYKEITIAEIVKYILMQAGHTVIDYTQGQLESREGLQGFKEEINENNERVCLMFLSQYITKETMQYLQKISETHKIVLLSKFPRKLQFTVDNVVYGDNGLLNDIKDYTIKNFTKKNDLSKTELLNIDTFCKYFDKRTYSTYMCNLYLAKMSSKGWSNTTLCDILETGSQNTDSMEINETVDINFGIKLQVYAATQSTAHYLYWLYNRLGLLESNDFKKMFFTYEEVTAIQDSIYDKFQDLESTIKTLKASTQVVSNTYGVKYATVLLVQADHVQEDLNEVILRLYLQSYGYDLIVCSFNRQYGLASKFDLDKLQQWCTKNGLDYSNPGDLNSYLKNPTNFFKIKHSKVKLSKELNQQDLKNIIASMH